MCEHVCSPTKIQRTWAVACQNQVISSDSQSEQKKVEERDKVIVDISIAINEHQEIVVTKTS